MMFNVFEIDYMLLQHCSPRYVRPISRSDRRTLSSLQYLDTQRISDLTLYLEALHRGGHASADHTTLLINCYTKLRLTEQLDQFIQVRRASETRGGVNRNWAWRYSGGGTPSRRYIPND